MAYEVTTEGTRPTGEVSIVQQVASILSGAGANRGWGRFIQEGEHVPELKWPERNEWFERMMTDSQVEALYLGTTLPVEQYHWWLDPNEADPAMTELLAADLGLPVGPPESDEEDQDIAPGLFSFDFAQHLREALLAVAFGLYYFEHVGVIGDDDRWHLQKLAAISPATIRILNMTAEGELVSVVQNIWRTPTTATSAIFPYLAPSIDADRLAPYVWRSDARARWVGRPMLRSLYRHWLLKDTLLRIDAINHERAGGVPMVETDETFVGTDLTGLADVARNFRVGEESGAAMPPGAKMVLKALGGSDVIASVQYHDEAMARVWQAMVMQLGQTETGSRALGQTMAGIQDSAQQAIAKWFRMGFREGVIRKWWANNVAPGADGSLPPHPLLACRPRSSATQSAPPVPSTYSPPGVPPPVPPPVAAAGLPSPRGPRDVWREAPAGQGGRGGVGGGRVGAGEDAAPPGYGAYPRRAPDAAVAATPTVPRASGAVAGAAGMEAPALNMPDRPMRRLPYPHEVMAAANFGAMDDLHAAALGDALTVLQNDWLDDLTAQVAAKVKALGDNPDPVDLAAITLDPPDAAPLVKVLRRVADDAADGAGAELADQGVIVGAAEGSTIADLIGGQAEAMARQVADGVALAATRRAVQLNNPAVDTAAADLASGVTDYLTGLAHSWEERQLNGAVQQAQTAGRFARFQQIDGPARFYVSALLDGPSCCEVCVGDDGLEFATLDEAMAWAPSGGNPDCLGGPNCRCTVVAVAGDEI